MVVVNVLASRPQLVALEYLDQLVSLDIVVVVQSALGSLQLVDPSVWMMFWPVEFMLESLGDFTYFGVFGRHYFLGDLCREIPVDEIPRLTLRSWIVASGLFSLVIILVRSWRVTSLLVRVIGSQPLNVFVSICPHVLSGTGGLPLNSNLPFRPILG